MARILAVDDKPHNVRLLQGMLTPHGYEVIPAYDGRQALELVRQNPPDLIITDVIMPGMDGFELTRILRAQPESEAIPILMLTALREMTDKTKGLEAGADDFLSKPFSQVELLARSRSLLRIKQLHDELQLKNALLERVLMRYISKDVAREILTDTERNLQLGGHTRDISVLFADIRGFTAFSEQREASQVTQMLNLIFSALSPLVFEHSGTLDKYLGDAIMAFYGAPIASADSAAQAVRTAWAMQQRFARLREETPALAESRLGLGIGIFTGAAVVGNIGSERMMNYTVIGNTPNTARRLQETAQPGQILIDKATYQAVKALAVLRPTKPLHLKGRSQPVKAYEVLAVESARSAPVA
jgi:class 3 adenylate cyclase